MSSPMANTAGAVDLVHGGADGQRQDSHAQVDVERRLLPTACVGAGM